MKKYLVPVIAGVMCFSSCQKNVQLTLPTQPSRLVLEAEVTTGSNIYAGLSKTMDILNYKPWMNLFITNATVTLQDNGQTIDTLHFDSNWMAYMSGVVAQEGHSYTLSFTAPGFPASTATAIAQSPVNFDWQVNESAGKNADGRMMDELVISFTDPAGPSPDHYRIQLSKGAKDDYISSCIEGSDPGLEPLGNDAVATSCLKGKGIYLNDQRFDGQKKDLHLFIEHGDLQPVTDSVVHYTVIRLEHLSGDYYDFLYTKAFLEQNNGNPFAEPTNVHTNVKNGYGIFSVSGKVEKEIKL